MPSYIAADRGSSLRQLQILLNILQLLETLRAAVKMGSNSLDLQVRRRLVRSARDSRKLAVTHSLMAVTHKTEIYLLDYGSSSFTLKGFLEAVAESVTMAGASLEVLPASQHVGTLINTDSMQLIGNGVHLVSWLVFPNSNGCQLLLRRHGNLSAGVADFTEGNSLDQLWTKTDVC